MSEELETKISKKKSSKKESIEEVKYTDILQEFVKVDGVEKVKRTYLNGEEIVKEEVINH
jgi:hypothetical protein